MLEVSFTEIKTIEILISKTNFMAPVFGMPQNIYLANLKVKLENNKHMYFDSLIISDIPRVISIFEDHNVQVVDIYNVNKILESQEDETVHAYFEKNLDRLAEEKGLVPTKQAW